jgi:hypothetical protein
MSTIRAIVAGSLALAVLACSTWTAVAPGQATMPGNGKCCYREAVRCSGCVPVGVAYYVYIPPTNWTYACTAATSSFNCNQQVQICYLISGSIPVYDDPNCTNVIGSATTSISIPQCNPQVQSPCP